MPDYVWSCVMDITCMYSVLIGKHI